MKNIFIAFVLSFGLQVNAKDLKNDVEEVKYRRLQATPELYIGKTISVRCDIVKYVADRKVLNAICGSESESTSGPCIYPNNDWICLSVPQDKKKMIDYLIDDLKPGASTSARIIGKLTNKKTFVIEEIRICGSVDKCEPSVQVLK